MKRGRRSLAFMLRALKHRTLLVLCGLLLVLYPFTHNSASIITLTPPSIRHVDFRGPLRQACNSVTEWEKNVFLQCDVRMGAFNAINKLQVCVRWAIDGGVGLVTPDFMVRGKDLEVRGEFPHVALDYLMDSAHLFQSLKLHCPEMKIVNISELGKYNKVEGHRVQMNEIVRKGEYKKFVHDRIAKTSSIDHRLPIVINGTDSLGNWACDSDSLDFHVAFRDIFRFNPKLIGIAQHILERLPYSFIGVHLRLEDDWLIDRKELSMEDFLQAVAARVAVAHTRTVYTACGDVVKLQEFQDKAAQRGIEVVSKWDLVSAHEREGMERELAFDQLAIVDYEVLYHSSFFVGYAGSSFSAALGQRRHFTQFGNFAYTSRDEQQYLIGPYFQTMWLNRLW